MAMLRTVLRWGYGHVWDKWPILIIPLIRKFRLRHGHYPNLLRPRSFNEKILWRMLFDRRQILTIFAGELESRDYVQARLQGDAALIPLVGVAGTAGDIHRMALPAAFAVKANHGSGMVQLHRGPGLPDRSAIERLIEGWQTTDYGKYSGEWVYKRVRRAAVVERLMLDDAGGLPKDFKFFCYDGLVHYIQVDSDRFTNHTRDIFDRDWNRLPVRFKCPNSVHLPPKPQCLARMIEISETLSAGMDFVRVDLYDTVDDVKFGEITNTPEGGSANFYPETWDLEFGKHWRLPRPGHLGQA
jgi:hypothetical protein